MLKDHEKFDKQLDNFAWNSRVPFRSTGQNKIYLGKDLVQDRQVIIKVLPLNQFTDEYILNTLLNDWQKVQSLKSPLLCETFSILLSKNNLYIFEDFYAQGNLKEFVKENSHRDNFIEKILKYINDLVKALDFLATNGNFHGDLKPENLIISNGFLKMNDFAFKRNLFRKNPNHLYQSYEQIKDKNQNLSIQNDVWALGCIVYELFSNTTPFFGLTEYEMLQSLEKDLFKIPPQIKDPDIIELISGILQNPKGKGWSLSKVINSSLIRRLRIAEGMTSKSTINDLDYNAKLILMGLAGTIKRNKLDLEELFKKFDSSGDMSIELDEFEKLLRVLDPKLSEIQIQRVFNLMDHDGSGSISFEELKELMGLNVGKTENGFVENKDMEAKIKKMMYVLRETINRNGLNINAIFSRYDDSGDMSLDSTEFYNLLRDIYPSIEEAMATYLFKKLDYDGSGDLGLNEFKSYVMEDKDLEKKLKDLEEKTQEAVNFMRNMMYGQKLDMRKLFAKADIKNRGKINEGEFKELILLIDNGITKEIIRNIFKKIDKDGSGFIEYEEFSNYLK